MLDTHGWKPTRELAPGEVVGLNGDGRSRLRMLEGRAWITEESRPDDWFVEAGQSLVPGRGTRVVIEALSASRIELESRPALAMRRWRLRLASALERLAAGLRPAAGRCET